MRGSISFLVIVLIFSVNLIYGQSDDCKLTVEKFINLINANNNTAQNILMPCYTSVNGVIGARSAFRVDYRVNNIMDYNLIMVNVTGQVAFYTSSLSAYNYYKKMFISYGFKYIKDDDIGSVYTLNKYSFWTYNAKNKDGKTGYAIQLKIND